MKSCKEGQHLAVLGRWGSSFSVSFNTPSFRCFQTVSGDGPKDIGKPMLFFLSI